VGGSEATANAELTCERSETGSTTGWPLQPICRDIVSDLDSPPSWFCPIVRFSTASKYQSRRDLGNLPVKTIQYHPFLHDPKCETFADQLP
ncbi:MAG: hypothetical protein AAB390_00040, partial [Patescibacteria group bacterium]